MSNCTCGITANILSLPRHFTFFLPTGAGRRLGLMAQVRHKLSALVLSGGTVLGHRDASLLVLVPVMTSFSVCIFNNK